MSKARHRAFVTAGAVLLALLVAAWIFFGATTAGRRVWNNWFYSVQRVDDDTNYETIKAVEDTCRALISSYEADKYTYEQYRDSEDEEQLSWAEQARMRANRTVAT